MSNTVNRTTTFTPEQDRAISNRAWLIFNSKLNEGLLWSAAKNACIAQIKKQRDDYDNAFEPDAADPIRSALEWEVRIDQFNLCIHYLNDIP